MYVPGMASHPALPGIVPFPHLDTPLGAIRFGGHLDGTIGTGWESWRDFSYTALVLVRGAGRYRDRRGADQRLADGDLIVVLPGRQHMYGPERGDHWRESFVAFDGPIADLWRGRGLDLDHPVWRLARPAAWQQRFAALLRDPPGDPPGACARVGALHGLIAALVAARPHTHEPAWLPRVRAALARTGASPALPTLAAMAGLSGDGLRRAFRRATGITPAAFRRQQQLAQAAQLAAQPDLTLAEIAAATGFCDAFHLSKAWKRAYGRSPRAAR